MTDQPEFDLRREEDLADATRRAFARLWLGCRDGAKRKGYRLDVDETRWKQVEREAR